jgi:hypothetical protein
MRCPHCGKNIAIPENAAPLLDDSQMRTVQAISSDWMRRLDSAERALLVLQNDAADRAKQIVELRAETKQLLASIALLEEATRGK